MYGSGLSAKNCRHFSRNAALIPVLWMEGRSENARRHSCLSSFYRDPAGRVRRSWASPKEAARGADALILMVVNASQAHSVLSEAGALEALAPDATVILMATCAPADAAALARAK